jgi:hypothetical protein
VDFFPEPAALPAADRRDAVLLGALREALDDLASNRYAAAFANVAGGSSGDAESLLYASQLPKWLTVDHHRVPMNRREVPSAPRKPETAKPPGAGGAAGSGTSPLLAFRTP